LTLTSEWIPYRWRPLTSGGSLVDANGFMYLTEAEAAAHLDPRQAESELRAQIARAKALGIRPTHVDSHMGTLYQTKPLFDLLMRMARNSGLPARVAKADLEEKFRADRMQPNDVVVDRIISIGSDVPAEKWAAWYADQIRHIQPGLTEMVIHLGFDDAELRAITANHPRWGAAWRQRDFDFFTSDEFRRLLRENGIQLTTWREAATRKEAR
ncbi:MAG TPA: ChbG/HpnK family deacetylase, partial [Thermoanaerobaculia bacterium]|nr:ChbG/HpnK family deacetylase [Thermoanaerobaculia bacterium]